MTLERMDTHGVARWIHTARPAAELAERIADTEFVPRALRGNAPAVAACIMYGDEIGVGPMTALVGIHVIDGRPFLSAELMRALVLGAGHRIRVVESTGTRCVVIGWRREDAPYRDQDGNRVEWTIEMARAAGIAGRGAWRSYPRALLLARASADLCRMAFSDVVRGLGHIPDTATPEMVSDWAEYAGSLGPEPDAPALPATETVQWEPPAPAPAKRTRRPRKAVEAPAPVEDVPAPVEPPPTSGEAPGSPVPANASPDPNPVPWEDEPEPEPEPAPAPVLEAEDPTARVPDPALVTRIMAAYGDLPFGPDRNTRLAVFSGILGRPVTSTNELDRMSAYRLFGGLKDLATGVTVAVDDGHGVISIHPGTEPEPEE